MALSNIDRMKKILREEECPFFSDDDLEFYLEENKGNVSNALYQCFLVKAEDTALLSSLDTIAKISFIRSYLL